MIDKPLAFRMRPTNLDDVIGQEKLKSFLNKLLSSNNLLSMIFYGPPGTGKTTIAKAFANSFNAYCVNLNAVIDNKQTMENAFQEAIRFNPSIVIIDEIHRLDKGKQDLLLPHLENGDFFIIGCTTANPLISLNPAIRSRTRLLATTELSKDDVLTGLKRAVTSSVGLNNTKKLSDEALEYIAKVSAGDMRFAYNQLEALALSYSNSHLINLDDAKEIVQCNYYADKDSDEHYDSVSALQKSIRGSDVDAAIYYLAKLNKTGDLETIIRRLTVTAYEDVALGNPQAVDRCLNACNVARDVGFPEASIPLAFTVCDLALSPKSHTSNVALNEALNLVEEKPLRVREYLRLKRAGISKEDEYPYDSPEVWDLLEYLPEEIEDVTFYHPEIANGKYDQALASNYLERKKIKKSKTIKDAKRRANYHEKI